MSVRNFIIGAAVVCCAFIAQSCGSLMPTSKYVVNLSTVESPENAKVQFGETKVVTFNEGDVQKYRYEATTSTSCGMLATKSLISLSPTRATTPSKSTGMTSAMWTSLVMWAA